MSRFPGRSERRAGLTTSKSAPRSRSSFPGVDLHIALEEDRGPLSRQIYDQVRDAILDGRLRPGDKIPSTRELARALDISRNTVSAAVDHLSGEGFVTGRAGVGTFVSDAVRADPPGPSRTDSPLRAVSFWDRQPSPPDLSRWHPEYDFRSGLPDGSRFPYSTWRRLMSGALRQATLSDGAYADPAGHVGLRRAIARHLSVSRGLRVDPSVVIVSSGVQQAVGLTCQVLLEPGDIVAVEDPGYPPVRTAFEAVRATIVDVPVDDEGIVVDSLPDQARLVYVSPAHQYPLGVAMSLRRRLALLEWARGADAAILEDDYDTEFRYTGRPLDSIHTLDPTGRVVYVGSFSKSMLPILRLGYCIVPAGLATAYRQAKYVADWHNPVPSQLALAQFIDDGHLVRHVRRMRRIYQARRDGLEIALDTALRRELRRIPTVAGLHLSAWARDADPAEVAAWVRRAQRRGVALQSLSDFAHQPEVSPGLIFGFGAIQIERIDAGLAQLRDSRPCV